MAGGAGPDVSIWRVKDADDPQLPALSMGRILKSHRPSPGTGAESSVEAVMTISTGSSVSIRLKMKLYPAIPLASWGAVQRSVTTVELYQTLLLGCVDDVTVGFDGGVVSSTMIMLADGPVLPRESLAWA
jgi:hypothetical protein